MTEYLCLTLLARADEPEDVFKTRLTAFWTHVLRTQPDTYDAVFAEAKTFDTTDGHVSRAYMIEADAIDAVTQALVASGVDAAPVDADDLYTKYEASGSEWFQLAH